MRRLKILKEIHYEKSLFKQNRKDQFEIDVLSEELNMFMEKDLLFQFDNVDILKKTERKLKYKDWLLTVLLIPKRFID